MQSGSLYFDAIEIENFRKFENFQVEFDPSFNLLIGDNGVGKSSILDALRISIGTFLVKLDIASNASLHSEDVRMSYSDFSQRAPRPVYHYPISIRSKCSVDDVEYYWERALQKSTGKTTWGSGNGVVALSDEWQRRLNAGDESLVLPFFGYYGTNRLWKPRNTPANDKLERFGRLAGYDDCLGACIDYELMRRWFKQQLLIDFQGVHDANDYALVKDAVARCVQHLTGFSDVQVYYDAAYEDIALSYRDDESAIHRDSLHALSDGYREIITLVSDIAYRMAVLNPNLGDDALAKTPGVVLIDEIDLHLHPKWQSQIIGVLRSTFPAVQFITTTHAPVVIASIDGSHIRKMAADGAWESVDLTYGRDVSEILQRVMHAKDRPEDVLDLFQKAYGLIDQGKISKAKDVVAALEKMIGGGDSRVDAVRTSIFLYEADEADDID